MGAEPPAPRPRIGPYAEPASRRRAVAAWCLYDFANSAYTTLIITVAYSVYFREAVVNAPGNAGDRLWGLANFLAMLAVAVVSPVVGALADESGLRKRFLILSTLQAVIATALLYFVTPGRLVAAMALYIVATIGFEIGYVFYNAFLPDLSTPKTIGRVSGWGWGLGYVGGLASLALCAPLLSSELKDAGGSLVESAVRERRLSFVLVAVFYLLFSLPAFLALREGPVVGQRRSSWSLVSTGFGRVAGTLRQLRNYRETGKFMLASLFFNDGITTIIIFSATYATVTFGFASSELIGLFLVLNVIALPGAVLAGYLADVIGARNTLILTLMLWIGVVLTGYLAGGRTAFWIMAAGAALGMGGTQAVGRSFMAEISPTDHEAEFFGFYALAGKCASIFGPLIFGIVSASSGSQRLAVLSLLPLFVVSLLIMLSIDVERARTAARGAAS